MTTAAPVDPAAIRHVHLDAVGGIAGDMFVAALLDALPALRDRVLADVVAVLPPACGAARLENGTSGGLAVLRFGLQPPAEPDHHHHHHDDHHPHHHHHHHAEATRFVDLSRRIAAAPLSAGTAERAVAILTTLAAAESRVHGVAIDEVHFHEIADWDSLMDVVAAGSIAAALSGATWSVSDLPRGGGLVKTQHGLLPVPAPATAAILAGFRWRDDGVGGERVTPTGAAIVATLVADADARAVGRLAASGMGAGTRTLPGLPNIVRALVFAAGPAAEAETVAVVAFDVDDMTGEEIGLAAERLRAVDGVIDLTLGQRAGKKHRPVTDFRLLVRPERLQAVATACFTETATIGLRWHHEARTVLPRRLDAVSVAGHAIRRKRTTQPDGRALIKAESDDLAALDGGLALRRDVKRRAEQDEETP
jgi:uncharacterized protein (TIGR00299 family) protein